MEQIERYRSRLAALTTAAMESPDAIPGEALAACRAQQSGLRQLKKEVLAHLLTLRARAREDARRSLAPNPSLKELWERRDEGARELLDDVRERVTGLFDDADAEAVEAWGEISREIDERLDRLRELEPKLARAAGEEPAAALGLPGRRRLDRDAGDDDLYAAVGAAVQKGSRPGAFCSQCGQGVASGDRFCRHCGHRLA
jgi:hypothetical protein